MIEENSQLNSGMVHNVTQSTESDNMEEREYEERALEKHYNDVLVKQKKIDEWAVMDYCIVEWYKDKQYDNEDVYEENENRLRPLDLLNYEQKLAYLEHICKSYYMGFHEFYLEDTFVAIKPESNIEIAIYNKWVINNWRDWLKNGKERVEKDDFSEVYIDAKELFDVYLIEADKLNKVKRAQFLRNQFEKVDAFMARSEASVKLIEKLTYSFQYNSEEEIYSLNVDLPQSVQTDLKTIAQIWDMLKYKAYLGDEAKRFLHDKENKAIVLKMKQFSDEQIAFMYKQLINKGFIHGDTAYISFKHVILQKEVKEIEKIRWVDTADNQSVNKVPLVEFANSIVIGDSKDVNTFIVNYFVTSIGGISANIFSKSINDSRKIINKQLKLKTPKTIEQDRVLQIVEAVYKMK